MRSRTSMATKARVSAGQELECQPGGRFQLQSLYILPGTVNDAYFLPSPQGWHVALARVIHGSILTTMPFRLAKTSAQEDIAGRLIFLGTGTSHGVPVIGCGCARCTSPDARNQRTRCAVLLGLPEGNRLIDTPPELPVQLLGERVGCVHAMLYTHAPADHLMGLDNLHDQRGKSPLR
jgi:hypothetical protein